MKKIVAYTWFWSNQEMLKMDLTGLNQLIFEGWQPYGFTFEHDDGIGQALVKYEDNDE